MSDMNPKAGWYTDPEDATKSRYWNGESWTNAEQPGPPSMQSRVDSGIEKSGDKPFYKKWWFIAIVVLLVLSVIGSNGDSGEDAQAVTESPSVPATISPSPIIESASPTESASPLASPAPDSPVYFYTSASGDLFDMNKDLDDMLDAVDSGGTFRLASNVLAVEFNLGELQSLTPPEEIAMEWASALLELEASIDVVVSDVSGEAKVSTLKKDIEEAKRQISSSQEIVDKLQ